MTRFFKWVFIGFFVTGMLLGMLVGNSLDDYSNVSQPSPLTNDQLTRVKQFIKRNNPARLQSGVVANTQISQQDLNHVLNYLSKKAPQMLNNRLHAKAVFDNQQALLQMSMQLPSNPVGGYINVSATLHSTNLANKSLIEIKSLEVGGNRLPDFITAMLVEYLHQQLILKATEYSLLLQSIQKIEFKKQRLSLEYVWDKQAVEKIKGQLSSRVISEEFKEALIAHANHLAKSSHKLSARPGLNDLLQPMFSYALLRSEQHDPIIENKAIFIALGAYALNKNIPRLLGEKPESIVRSKEIYLKQRRDLSKHFMLSAAITSIADSAFASSVGLKNEMKDSQGGSGFSFADLAADHAGIALAEKAIASEEQAREMQRRLSSVSAQSEYMPDIDNLPEGLAKSDFEYQYTDTSSAAYKDIEQLIAYRIKNLPVYR